MNEMETPVSFFFFRTNEILKPLGLDHNGFYFGRMIN